MTPQPIYTMKSIPESCKKALRYLSCNVIPKWST